MALLLADIIEYLSLRFVEEGLPAIIEHGEEIGALSICATGEITQDQRMTLDEIAENIMRQHEIFVEQNY